MIRCACCGRTAAGFPSAQEIVVSSGMSTLEERFFKLLWDADGSWKTSFEIVAEIYSDRIDGGPLCPSQTMSQRKKWLNDKLDRFGITIESSRSGFRLVKRTKGKNDVRKPELVG